MRLVRLTSICLVGAGCALTNTQESDAAAAAARECIRSQIPLVATTNTDLETATEAVLGRCSAQINAERQAFIGRFPGYRDYIEVRWREVDRVRREEVRKAIAVLRAR